MVGIINLIAVCGLVVFVILDKVSGFISRKK